MTSRGQVRNGLSRDSHEGVIILGKAITSQRGQEPRERLQLRAEGSQGLSVDAN